MLTDHIEESQQLAEEVSVGPEVVVLQVGVQVVQEELLLLPLLHLGDDAQVQVHHQRLDLARFPVLPQPPRDVEEDCLRGKKEMEGKKWTLVDLTMAAHEPVDLKSVVVHRYGRVCHGRGFFF